MLKIRKPYFWDKKNSFLSILLFPVSLITLIIVFFRKRFSCEIKFKIPVLCVGNIYIGGTGKTPTSIFIADKLFGAGVKSVIIRKNYKSHLDEYNQIKKNFKHLIIGKNRVEAIKEAEKKGYEIAILDDGFQDIKIKKDLNIICFHQNQLAGNEFVLPAGPLRESLNSLKEANLVLINGEKNFYFEERILKINKDLEIFYSYYKPVNINEFNSHKLLAVAGIANPNNFFELLEKNNLQIEKKLIFPDHYKFTKNEIINIVNQAKSQNLKIIMTEKDFFKVNNFDINEINYLKVSLEIQNKEKFLNRIKKII